MAKYAKGAELLKEFMKAHFPPLRPEDMAKILGMKKNYFYQFQGGNTRLTIDHLQRLAEKGIFTPEQINELLYAYGHLVDKPYDPRTMALPTEPLSEHPPAKKEKVEEEEGERYIRGP